MGVADPNLKLYLWETISDPFNEDSMQAYFWKEDAFTQFGSQYDLMEPFLDLWYAQAPMLVNFQEHQTKAIRFLRNISPAGRASKQDLERFQDLLAHAEAGIMVM